MTVFGYSITYLNEWEEVTCAECMNGGNYKEAARFVHWEGPSLWCDDCGEEIPSEYGEVEKD